jgi:GTPase SAR1 family protein
MTLSKYFEIQNPTYTVLQITPHSSCRNYSSDTIAKTISTIKAKIHKEEKKYIFETKMKCVYMIDIYKNDVRFYFVVPVQYKLMVKEKLISTWPAATVTELEQEIRFHKDSVYYNLQYVNNDALALTVDKKSNVLLNSLMNVIEVMDQGDRVTVMYNFAACSQYGWQAKSEKVHNNFLNNMPVPKEMSGGATAFKTLCLVLDFLDSFINSILGHDVSESNPLTELKNVLMQNSKKLSNESLYKRNDAVLDTQIAVISYADNKIRANNNAIMACQSFRSLDGDNKLEYYKCVPGKYVKNKIGVNESSMLLQIPGRDLLEKHKITHVNTTESNVPEELKTGIICIGDSTCKGNTEKAYLSTDSNLKYLTVCVIGPTRAGKTTLIGNMCNDALNVHETNIVLDWCGNCELSSELIDLFPRSLVINCNDFSKLQGLGYNELYTTSKDKFEIYRSAKQQSSQLMTLINASMGGDEDLRARMERYLGAAAIIVFMSSGAVKDVFLTLQDYNTRHDYIDRLGKSFDEYIGEYISYLLELDDKNETTKLSAVQGILNRLSKLKENPYMEMMLKKDCKDNFNLVDEMQNAQLICIKMPEIMFQTEQEKDTYATYWLTKIWGALQQRKWFVDKKDIVKVNIFFDELYQVESCQEFLRSKLSQIAKFGAKPIISCHYLEQIKIIRNELKSANSSYILIAGSDKDNYNELKSELYPYTLEDLLNLKRFHALNLIKYEGGYAKFITQLPKPIA